MNTPRRDRNMKISGDILKKSPTRDIGVLCSDLVPVNDKCIMVGTTGIAALKAEYGDDFTNFEIIQDVGYSSESSTHLSSDDGIGIGGNRYYNFRVYKYTDDKSQKANLSLKEELENACAKQFHSLSSSVDSSTGGTSFNDSGVGTTDGLVGEDASEASKDHSSVDEKPQHDCGEFSNEEACLPGEELDFLETVLESCSDFSNDDIGKNQNIPDNLEELPFSFSGIDSDGTSGNFHNRASFTKSAQVFYKMISVDSDNCEDDLPGNDLNKGSVQVLHQTESVQTSETFIRVNSRPLHATPDSDSEKDILFSANRNLTSDFKQQPQRHQKLRTSTPLRKQNGYADSSEYHHPLNLKRKRGSDSTSSASVLESTGLMPNQVRSWLTRCSLYNEPPQRTRSKRTLFRNDQDSFADSAPNLRNFSAYDDLSSCDASGEYTSSSADEGNILSSSTSYLEDSFNSKERLDSYSVEGSVETVIRNLSTSLREDSDSLVLLPCAASSPQSEQNKINAIQNVDGNDYQLTTLSCEEMLVRVGKASSDDDLRVLSMAALSNVGTTRLKKEFQPKGHAGNKRLSNSLPSILCHRSGSSTEDAYGSTLFSDTRKSHHSLYQSPKSCHTLPLNFSSSSELGKKKRRRKKSSNSARSSRSALNNSDHGRQRSRTLTNSLTGCSSRGRHFSQQSNFIEGPGNNIFSEDDGYYLDVKLSHTDDLVRKNLSEEFAQTLDDSSNECVNSEILSPVETHLEEQSTVSDQVWDSYQEMPYLSEGYSEATVDEDAIRKLTEFGDDYTAAIGQPLRFIDASDSNKGDAPKSPKKSSKSLLVSHSQKTCPFSNDSDSDSEDLHHVIEEARRALQFATTTLKKGLSSDFFTSAEYADLLATCGTHIRYLQTICEHIESDGKGNNFSFSDLEELRYLIKEWHHLNESAEMYNLEEDNVKQKYVKVKKNIDALFTKMSELSASSDVQLESFDTWEQLKEKMSQLQTVMTTLQDTKEQLLAVNLEVHLFRTDHGSDVDYRECSLKEDVTELYQKWTDIYENNEKQLTSLEVICNKWKMYKEKIRVLLYNLICIENVSTELGCDKSFIIRESSSLTKNLIDLQEEAKVLKEFLKGGATRESIDLELQDLAERINKYTRTTKTSRSIDHPVSIEEEDPDDKFEDAIQQLDGDNCKSSYRELQGAAGSKKEDAECVPKRKSSRFWRIIRIAVPVQLALVFLYCLACCLEPNCCDTLNNFNLSLSPHLRYFRGPPPA